MTTPPTPWSVVLTGSGHTVRVVRHAEENLLVDNRREVLVGAADGIGALYHHCIEGRPS
jgi:hypothetical protein